MSEALQGAIIGALAVMIASFGTWALSEWSRTRIARFADLRALRDATRERLRLLYQPIMVSLIERLATTDLLLPQHGFVPRAQREQIAEEAFDRIVKGAQSANAALLLEKASDAVLDHFDQMNSDFADFVQFIRYLPDEELITKYEQLAPLKAMVRGEIQEVQIRMREHLAELEHPVELPSRWSRLWRARLPAPGKQKRQREAAE